MALHRRLAPRRFTETVALASDPDVRFYLRFSPQEADELANFVAPPQWGHLCRTAAGFVQDWDGVCAEDGTPVPWSLEEFYGRLTAAERLEFAQAAVSLVYGEAAGWGSEADPFVRSAGGCRCSSPGLPGNPSGGPSPRPCSSIPSSASIPA